MTQIIRPAIVMLALFTAITGLVYPLAITAIAQVIFPNKANGSLIVQGDKIIGSELIGQPFDGDTYFWSRPSATGPFAYNAGASSGSNLGPTNADFLKTIGERVEAIKKAHPDQTGPVPGDLVTASASGLDPHISPAAAEFQANRVAKAFGITVEKVRQLIGENTESRTFGVLGEPRVHVLKLNLALDRLHRGIQP